MIETVILDTVILITFVEQKQLKSSLLFLLPSVPLLFLMDSICLERNNSVPSPVLTCFHCWFHGYGGHAVINVCSFFGNYFNADFIMYQNVCPDGYKLLLALTVFQSVILLPEIHIQWQIIWNRTLKTYILLWHSVSQECYYLDHSVSLPLKPACFF